jgi:acyl carrier protein
LSAGPLPTLDPAGATGPAPDGSADEPTVLREVSDMIVAVIGEDYLFDVVIDMDTSFQDDLEIESIEFVALAEQLHTRYGDEVDFVLWLADKELDDIIALTVGDVVRFIASCRAGV